MFLSQKPDFRALYSLSHLPHCKRCTRLLFYYQTNSMPIKSTFHTEVSILLKSNTVM